MVTKKKKKKRKRYRKHIPSEEEDKEMIINRHENEIDHELFLKV